MSNVEKKIVQTRQLLSKASAEQEAIQNRAKMTKRRVKRRKLISLECKSLSVKDLTEFIDKLKQRLKNLTRQNKQQKARQLQRKWDSALQSDPGSVFKHLAKSLEKNKEEEKPRLSQDEKKFERTPCEEENHIILRTPRKLTRSGEDYGKQKQKIIWTRRGSRKLRKVWERKWARKKL